ncbi:Ivy family c-type lysozyme inhibitor [Pantoea stewartii]|uniref:Ivy family c-type lysozyme inhibitor n=1 Tax=Pantoea stewartii TaxID=66269 RepID=UPI001981932C|nr:Ivy family c-type lysozyme inhibitor [Pantoea stewartii]
MKLCLNDCIRSSVFSLLLISAYGHAESKIATAEQAMNCSTATIPGTDDACPYPFDVEKNDEAFKETVSHAMEKAGLGKLWENEGVLRGPQTPLEQVTISGVTWLRSSSCEQDNCGEHNVVYLYQPNLKTFMGLYSNGG